MVSDGTSPKPVSCSSSGDRNTGSAAVTICFFKYPSMAVYFWNSAWFCRNFSVLIACYSALPVLRGWLHGLYGGKNANPICSVYSSVVIDSVRCPCRPPPRFDATDAAFPLINRCILISPYLVGSPSIFGRIGVGKSTRTPSTLIVAPAISSCTLVGIYSGFFPWENLSNLLKDRCRLTRRHWCVV